MLSKFCHLYKLQFVPVSGPTFFSLPYQQLSTPLVFHECFGFQKALVCQIRAAFSPAVQTVQQLEQQLHASENAKHEKKRDAQINLGAQYITDAFCISFFSAEHHKCIQPLAEISRRVYNSICDILLGTTNRHVLLNASERGFY